MRACIQAVLAAWSTCYGVTNFYARVKPENESSQKLLESCGFKRVQPEVIGLLSYGPLSRVVVYQYRRKDSA